MQQQEDVASSAILQRSLSAVLASRSTSGCPWLDGSQLLLLLGCCFGAHQRCVIRILLLMGAARAQRFGRCNLCQAVSFTADSNNCSTCNVPGTGFGYGLCSCDTVFITAWLASTNQVAAGFIPGEAPPTCSIATVLASVLHSLVGKGLHHTGCTVPAKTQSWLLTCPTDWPSCSAQ